jgi:hypothetical protein
MLKSVMIMLAVGVLVFELLEHVIFPLERGLNN